MRFALLLMFTATTALAAPPKLDGLFPAGGQRGQTVVVSPLGGGFDGKLELWSDRPGVVATPIDDPKEKGKWSLTIAADAPLGVHWLRMANADGASSRRPFFVGLLPEMNEAEPNDAPEKPQLVETPLIINGRLQKNGDVDAFRVRLSPGQTLVAHVDAYTSLGSPMDAALQLCRLVERKASAVDPPQIEAFVLRQNHDAIGLDPRIVFTAAEAGDYLVRLFAFPAEQSSGINFEGKDSYVYRLTLTTGPFVDHAFPPSIGREGGKVELVGWNLPESLKTLDIPAVAPDAIDPPPFLVAGEAPGLARVEYLDRPVQLAGDCSSAKPQAIALPAELCGRLLTPEEDDAFIFPAVKGKGVRVRVESRSLGFPLDSHLQITDEAGKTLQESDDAGKDRDSELTFSPPADGAYRVLVRDLFGRGGPRMIYRLSVAPVEADFRLSVASDTFVIAGEQSLEIPVTIDRRDGFAGDIELRAIGLPAEFVAEAVVSAGKGDTAKAVKLKLQAKGAAAGRYPFRILGVAPTDPRRSHAATFSATAPTAEFSDLLLTRP